MNRNQYQGRGRKNGDQRQSRMIGVSINEAINTANTFGKLLCGERRDPELLSTMVYSNGSSGGPRSNVDQFSRTGAKRLLPKETRIRDNRATLYFADDSENGKIASIVTCKILGHQMVGDWQVFVPAN